MRTGLAVFVACVFLAACSRGDHVSSLPTQKIVVDTRQGPHTFTVEIAANEAARQKGLMFRTELAPDAGMLFDFDKPGLQVFWMKNTPLSLDMLFIRRDGTVSTIVTNTIPYTLDPVASSEPVLAVLEINGGRSSELGIQPGDKVHAAVFGNAP